MQLQWNTPVSVVENVHYIINAQHRDGTKGKSKWRISEADELGCFRHALEQDYLVGAVGWGLHLVDGKPQPLGISEFGQPVKLAKFVDGNVNGQWHGYPADYQRKRQDVPRSEVLKKWMNSGIINTRQAAKVKGGKPCGL